MASQPNHGHIAIRSQRVVIEDSVQPATIHLKDGVIVKVEVGDAQTTTFPEGTVVKDYGNLVIMPGIVDTHVHINEPGRTEWEGFWTATRAAAAGGVTSLANMPLNSSPVTTSVDALKVKLDCTPNKLWMDVGMLGGVIPDNIDQIAPMVEAGVIGFKGFMVHSGIDEFPHIEETHIRAAMSEFVKLRERGYDVVFMFHAEVGGPIEEACQSLKARESECPDMHCKYETFLCSRPKEAENEAIALIIRLCREYRVRCHIVHLSSADAIDMLKEAIEEGLPITAETTYHYLYFAAEDIPERNTLFKCCPPIREKDNRDKLWDALGSGIIQMAISDHSPCTTDLKLLDSGDFMKAWGGISSLQLGLAIMWTEGKRRGYTIQHLAKWMCYATADLVGLSKRKGRIQEGLDADFVVWDPEYEWSVDENQIEVQNKRTPYHGETFIGAVKHTILRGATIYSEGSFTSDKPVGQVLYSEKFVSTPILD